MFHTPPNIIVYVYKHWQDVYDDLEKNHKNVIFQTHIPSEEELKELVNNNKHSLLICDDMMNDIGSNDFVRDAFTRLSHHLRITTILLLQNATATARPVC